MPIPLPDLDSRDFDSLMEEARALIPRYDQRWTNYNPSDPGITLLELFAWLCQQTLYRTNRIPLKNYEAFLDLLGVPLQPNESLESGIQRARGFLTESYRAVTTNDYENLILNYMNELVPGLGGRAIVLNAVDLSEAIVPTATITDLTKQGHVSVVVVPRCDTPAQQAYCEVGQLPLPVPNQTLLDLISDLLAERRLITTRTHAVKPFYRAVEIEAAIALERGADQSVTFTAVRNVITKFYSPLTGGPDGGGWPIGRDVFRSELFQLIESQPGVDHVSRVRLASGDSAPLDQDIRVRAWEHVNVTSIDVTRAI